MPLCVRPPIWTFKPMPLLRFLPEATNIDFIGVRYYAFALDGLLLLISIISIATHGFNLGLDFTGGVAMQVKSAQMIDVGKVRSEVGSLFNDPQIQNINGGLCDKPAGSCVLIRVQPKANQEQAAKVQIQNKLGSGYSVISSQVIGPKVSGELYRSGIYATILAIIAIAIWVAIRFEWQYGISAAIATGHDVFVTAGMFSLLHLDFTLPTSLRTLPMSTI